MVAEVAVGEAIHQPIAERIQLVDEAVVLRLRDAGTAAAGRREVGHRDHRRACELVGRVGRYPVDGELPEVEHVRIEVEQVVRRADRRRDRAVEVRGQHPAVLGVEDVAVLRSGQPAQHPRAVVRADLGADEVEEAEEVERDVVRVRPDSELRVVGEVVVLERVAPVRAGRIAGLRDGHALEVGQSGDRELADHPAVGQAIVDDRGVAVVVVLAIAAEAGEDRVRRHGPVQLDPALVVYRETLVDDLDVVVRADRAVRVGRQ